MLNLYRKREEVACRDHDARAAGRWPLRKLLEGGGGAHSPQLSEGSECAVPGHGTRGCEKGRPAWRSRGSSVCREEAQGGQDRAHGREASAFWAVLSHCKVREASCKTYERSICLLWRPPPSQVHSLSDRPLCGSEISTQGLQVQRRDSA